MCIKKKMKVIFRLWSRTRNDGHEHWTTKNAKFGRLKLVKIRIYLSIDHENMWAGYWCSKFQGMLRTVWAMCVSQSKRKCSYKAILNVGGKISFSNILYHIQREIFPFAQNFTRYDARKKKFVSKVNLSLVRIGLVL